jgi:hypothetical protein
MDGRRRRRIKERFDYGVGFFGFFTVAFFIITLVHQIVGLDSLAWAVTTLVLGVVVGLLLFARRETLRRVDLEPEEVVEED